MSNGELYNASNWMIIPMDYVRCLPRDEAMVLAHLSSFAAMQENDGKIVDEFWFRCGAERICERLNLSKRIHERVFNSLETSGFIERRMMGNPARRHLRIDYPTIKRYIDKKLESLMDLDNLPTHTGLKHAKLRS